MDPFWSLVVSNF